MKIRQEIKKALTNLGYHLGGGVLMIRYHSLSRYLVTVDNGYVGIYDVALHTFVD